MATIEFIAAERQIAAEIHEAYCAFMDGGRYYETNADAVCEDLEAWQDRVTTSRTQYAHKLLGDTIANLNKRQAVQDRISSRLAEQCHNTADGEFYNSESMEAYEASKEEWYRLVSIERRIMVTLYEAGKIAKPNWVLA
jgi:hypothetical protein